MKSIYNIGQVRSVSTTAITPLGQLTDVALSGVANDQALVFNNSSGKWTNQDIVNSFNSRTGDVSLVNDDIRPLISSYYNTVIGSTASYTAVPNTHYEISGAGGTITVNPFNVGEHLMVTARSATINIVFTGTSFVLNTDLAGGVSNPTFALVNTTIELICTFNSGQTYYSILRVSQNRPGASCTLNSTKISALAQLDNIPNVVLTSPSSGQVLEYNGTNWVNNEKNGYFDTVTGSTTSFTAVANTHYEIGGAGGTVTINPMNVGDHVMVTARTGAVNIVFTGTSFVLNTSLGGGVSNPTFVLVHSTVELVCTFNAGQTYYSIIRVSQNNPGATCTLNAIKISALSELDDIPNVVLSSPANNQVLSYNGTNWINRNPNSYYSLVTTGATITAAAGVHYFIGGGSTITINPMNVGDRVMISARLNTINVVFTGTSYVTNSIFGGGSSNPPIILNNTTIELVCTFNTGQTYYDIVRVSQNRPGAVCTLNGVKISALSELDDIPDVFITGASAGQSLMFNGGFWANTFGPRIYNSGGLILEPKTFIGSATTDSSGNFTLNISAAGFTTVDNIQVSGILGGSSATTAPIATIQTQSTTSITGIAVKSTAGVDGLTNVGSGIVVYITVIGT